jgi:hypothetical protein
MLSMDGSHPRKRAAAKKPGLKALEASGDGFWELDLVDGSAWFSRWFYQKLNWGAETKRTTLRDLEPVFEPAAWTELMACFRAHLEQGRPLALDLEASPPAGPERWRIRGAAHRNAAGQPVYLAGCMREEAGDSPTGSAAELLWVAGAFEALPVAAAVLDAKALLVQANRQWQALPAAATAQALARLRAANSQTAIEFWLDQADGLEAGPRHLRVRAIAFQHEGARLLTVTLEDRRSD